MVVYRAWGFSVVKNEAATLSTCEKCMNCKVINWVLHAYTQLVTNVALVKVFPQSWETQRKHRKTSEKRKHLWWGSRAKMLLPQLPDAMLGIVSSLSLAENFAVRASSRGIEISISEGFLRLRKLEIQSPVVHSLGTLVPKCLQGLQHMILTQGISLVNGHLPDLAEELAAAAHFAVQLPRLQRVDLTRYECSLLFRQSVGDQDVSELPVLPHCFLSNILFNAEARDCEGGQNTSRSFQFCLDEALIWCQLLKAAQGKRCSTAGQDWSTAVTSTRHAACAAVGPTARRFVAHALCSADGTEQLICDLRMLTKLEDLHLVGIPKGFVRIGRCRDVYKIYNCRFCRCLN